MMNVTTKNPGKKPIIQALEDAGVIFGFTIVSSLIALGWPPCIEVLYVPALSAGLVGLVAYAKARDIELGD